MKNLKRNKKAFGAFEYLIIISLVLVIALVILNIVKGKAGESISVLDKATSATESALNFEGGAGGGEVVSSINVSFSQSFSYDFEDEIDIAVQDYFATYGTVRKEGEIVTYSLSNIIRVGNYIQVDVEVDGETKREQFIFNNLCLATDSDFEWKTEWPWEGAFHYVGTAKCVEIPHAINGVEMTSYSRMFYQTEVERVISTNTNITIMHTMFWQSQATSLDLSRLNTSNVTNMGGMFEGSQATSINFKNFDTSKTTMMGQMFSNSNATSLDLSSFNTSNTVNMSGMFMGSQIISLDLSSFDFTKTNFSFDLANIFQGALTTEVLVKDEFSRNKLNTSSNKPAHTEIKIK